MGPNYELKCPKCGGTIIYDDIYDSDSGEDFVVNSCVGHCANCKINFQWTEEFEIKFCGVGDLEEVL